MNTQHFSGSTFLGTVLKISSVKAAIKFNLKLVSHTVTKQVEKQLTIEFGKQHFLSFTHIGKIITLRHSNLPITKSFIEKLLFNIILEKLNIQVLNKAPAFFFF